MEHCWRRGERGARAPIPFATRAPSLAADVSSSSAAGGGGGGSAEEPLLTQQRRRQRRPGLARSGSGCVHQIAVDHRRFMDGCRRRRSVLDTGKGNYTFYGRDGGSEASSGFPHSLISLPQYLMSVMPHWNTFPPRLTLLCSIKRAKSEKCPSVRFPLLPHSSFRSQFAAMAAIMRGHNLRPVNEEGLEHFICPAALHARAAAQNSTLAAAVAAGGY